MITLLRGNRTEDSSDLDPVLGVAASVLLSFSIYGVVGTVIAYFVVR